MKMFNLLLVVAAVTGIILVVDYFTGRKRRIAMGDDGAPAFVQLSLVAFPIAVIILLLLTINFEVLLTSAVILSGVVYFIDLFWLRRRRNKLNIQQPSLLVDYARSFFPVLLLVLVIRSFVVQPFRVPTGSLEPTVMPGDLIAVNQFAYGLRLPVWHTKIMNVGEPKVGDIVVFRWPVNPSIDFVKRVIGVPGDTIEYKDKVLYINGEEADQKILGPSVDVEEMGSLPAQKREEDLDGVKHGILVRPMANSEDFSITVPKGMYFMMGDNRDDSDDSRIWGFVPEQNLVGKAFIVWFSWDSQNHSVRWHRIGNKL